LFHIQPEQDRNHHGPAPNKLMPDVVNMETKLNILPVQGGKGKESFKLLQQTQQAVEMNLRYFHMMNSSTVIDR
jgi:hypothetical protein